MENTKTTIASMHLVFSTFPDEESAATIGTLLVKEKCAACVNIIRSIRSIYEWDGKLEDSNEVLVLFKVSNSTLESFMVRLKEQHPYSVPEIIALTAHAVLPAYLQWVVESCQASTY